MNRSFSMADVKRVAEPNEIDGFVKFLSQLGFRVQPLEPVVARDAAGERIDMPKPLTRINEQAVVVRQSAAWRWAGIYGRPKIRRLYRRVKSSDSAQSYGFNPGWFRLPMTDGAIYELTLRIIDPGTKVTVTSDVKHQRSRTGAHRRKRFAATNRRLRSLGLTREDFRASPFIGSDLLYLPDDRNAGDRGFCWVDGWVARAARLKKKRRPKCRS